MFSGGWTKDIVKKIMFGATHSGAGKTTVTLGLMHALTRRGLKVQPYKVGPDYIDTGWHKLATGYASFNLDAFMLPENNLKYLFQSHAKTADINIIEGVMGLYDGYGVDPNYCSSAGLAKILNCPIILVVDGKAVSTSIAATVMGFQKFQPNVPIVGVLVNRVNTDSHYQLLKQAIETYCQIPVLGRLPNMPELVLPERHLGLVPTEEMQDMQSYWQQLADAIEQYIEVDRIIELSAGQELAVNEPKLPNTAKYQGLTMAIAQDAAFHFYYQDNLDLLKQLGLQLIPFSPLTDSQLPECDLVYLGGGFPEVFAEQLAANQAMRQSILQAHQQAKPIYAECGGLMYLGESLQVDGKSFDMVGVLAGYSQMTKGLKRFGYCEGRALTNTLLADTGEILKGHEFHHSEFFTDLPCAFAMYKTRDGEVIKQWQGGYQVGNTLASYLHIHFYQNPFMLCHWLDRALV